MTNKKTNWEERFEKFISCGLNEGFDDGSFSQKAYRDRFAWKEEIKSFIRQLLTEEYKKGFNDCLKEQGFIGEENQGLYL